MKSFSRKLKWILSYNLCVSQLQQTMATITQIIKITKQYEFIPEIKSNILSYIQKAKKMKSANLWAYQICLDRFSYKTNFHNYIKYSRAIYELRTGTNRWGENGPSMSKDQLNFECNIVGTKAQDKKLPDILVITNRRLLKREIENYWLKNAHPNRFYCLFGNEYDFYKYRCRKTLKFITDHLNGERGLKDTHLKQIRETGQKSVEKQFIKYNELKKNETKKMRRQERVKCECCGKDLSRGSLSRHNKKCNTV